MTSRRLLACSIPLALLGACAQVPTARQPAPDRAVAPDGLLAVRSVVPAAPVATAPAAPARWLDDPLPARDTDVLRAGPAGWRVPAAAEGVTLSYTYAELGATWLDVENLGGGAGSEDVDSYYLDGSLGLGLIHLVATIENQSTDFQDTDTAMFRLGGGVHLSLMDKLDAVGEIAWLYSDVSSDISALESTNNGYQIRIGTRWLPIAWERGGIELEGNLIWVDIDNMLASDEDTAGFEIGARVHMLQLLSFGAMYTVFEDDELIGVNARVSF